MMPSDRNRFGLAMEAMAAVWRVELSEPWLLGYWAACEDMPLEAFQAAARAAMRTSEFMPAPAKLRALARGAAQAAQPLPTARRLGAMPAPPGDARVTVGDCVESSRRNAQIARQRVSDVRAQLRGEGPGTVRARLLAELSRALGEAEHWEDYVGYYQRCAAVEGPGAVVRAVRLWAEAA